MENYTKADTIERPLNARMHFADILRDRADVAEAHVKPNTREIEAVRHVISMLNPNNSEAGGEPTTSANYALIYGAGAAVKHAVSVVEMIKAQLPELHQLNKIKFARVLETWQPKLEGLQVLQVTRNTPAIFVLLSKQPFDDVESIRGYGYQEPSGGQKTKNYRKVDPNEREYFPHGRRGGASSYYPRGRSAAASSGGGGRGRGGKRRNNNNNQVREHNGSNNPESIHIDKPTRETDRSDADGKKLLTDKSI